MDIVDRLKLFMQYTGLSSSQFADSSAIPRPTLSQIITGRNKKISNEIFAKLHDAFPQLNIMWLMFGDGNMLCNPNNNETDVTKPETNSILNESHISDNSNSRIQQHLEFGSSTEKPSNLSVNLHKSDFFPAENVVNPNEPTRKPKQGPSPAVIFSQIYTKNSEINAQQNNNSHNSSKSTINATQDTSKRISSIMVFYSDNSFETFKPAE